MAEMSVCRPSAASLWSPHRAWCCVCIRVSFAAVVSGIDYSINGCGGVRPADCG